MADTLNSAGPEGDLVGSDGLSPEERVAAEAGLQALEHTLEDLPDPAAGNLHENLRLFVQAVRRAWDAQLQSGVVTDGVRESIPALLAEFTGLLDGTESMPVADQDATLTDFLESRGATRIETAQEDLAEMRGSLAAPEPARAPLTVEEQDAARRDIIAAFEQLTLQAEQAAPATPETEPEAALATPEAAPAPSETKLEPDDVQRCERIEAALALFDVQALEDDAQAAAMVDTLTAALGTVMAEDYRERPGFVSKTIAKLDRELGQLRGANLSTVAHPQTRRDQVAALVRDVEHATQDWRRWPPDWRSSRRMSERIRDDLVQLGVIPPGATPPASQPARPPVDPAVVAARLPTDPRGRELRELVHLIRTRLTLRDAFTPADVQEMREAVDAFRARIGATAPPNAATLLERISAALDTSTLTDRPAAVQSLDVPLKDAMQLAYGWVAPVSTQPPVVPTPVPANVPPPAPPAPQAPPAAPAVPAVPPATPPTPAPPAPPAPPVVPTPVPANVPPPAPPAPQAPPAAPATPAVAVVPPATPPTTQVQPVPANQNQRPPAAPPPSPAPAPKPAVTPANVQPQPSLIIDELQKELKILRDELTRTLKEQEGTKAEIERLRKTYGAGGASIDGTAPGGGGKAVESQRAELSASIRAREKAKRDVTTALRPALERKSEADQLDAGEKLLARRILDLSPLHQKVADDVRSLRASIVALEQRRAALDAGQRTLAQGEQEALARLDALLTAQRNRCSTLEASLQDLRARLDALERREQECWQRLKRDRAAQEALKATLTSKQRAYRDDLARHESVTKSVEEVLKALSKLGAPGKKRSDQEDAAETDEARERLTTELDALRTERDDAEATLKRSARDLVEAAQVQDAGPGASAAEQRAIEQARLEIEAELKGTLRRDTDVARQEARDLGNGPVRDAEQSLQDRISDVAKPLYVTYVNVEQQRSQVAEQIALERYEDELRGAWTGRRFMLRLGRAGFLAAYRDEALAELRRDPRAMAEHLRSAGGAAPIATLDRNLDEFGHVVDRVHAAAHDQTPDTKRSFATPQESHADQMRTVELPALTQLYRDYATPNFNGLPGGWMSDDEFRSRLVGADGRGGIIAQVRLMHPEIVGAGGDLSADNALRQAATLRATARHAGGVAMTDACGFRVVLAVARATDLHAQSLRTETQRQAEGRAQRIIGWLRRLPVIGPAVVSSSAVAAGVYCASNLVANSIVMRTSAYAAVGVGAALLAPTALTGAIALGAATVAGASFAASARRADVRDQRRLAESRDALNVGPQTRVPWTVWGQRAQVHERISRQVDPVVAGLAAFAALTRGATAEQARDLWSRDQRLQLLRHVAEVDARTSYSDQQATELERLGGPARVPATQVENWLAQAQAFLQAIDPHLFQQYRSELQDAQQRILREQQQAEATGLEQRMRRDGVLRQKLDVSTLRNRLIGLLNLPPDAAGYPTWTLDEQHEVLRSIAEYETRRDIGDERRIDLLRYGGAAQASRDRAEASQTIERCKNCLRRIGVDVQAELNRLRDAARARLVCEVEETDRRFRGGVWHDAGARLWRGWHATPGVELSEGMKTFAAAGAGGLLVGAAWAAAPAAAVAAGVANPLAGAGFFVPPVPMVGRWRNELAARAAPNAAPEVEDLPGERPAPVRPQPPVPLVAAAAPGGAGIARAAVPVDDEDPEDEPVAANQAPSTPKIETVDDVERARRHQEMEERAAPATKQEEGADAARVGKKAGTGKKAPPSHVVEDLAETFDDRIEEFFSLNFPSPDVQ